MLRFGDEIRLKPLDWKMDDVFEHVDADVLARTQAFVWQLLQRIDSR